MTESDLKQLRQDTDGLLAYEYLANNINEICDDDLNQVVETMIQVDLNGQFLASAAKYLNAIDKNRFAPAIKSLVAATIDKDREHRYLADLLTAIYGSDYSERIDTLMLTDNNFRRIYKRLYPKSCSL